MEVAVELVATSGAKTLYALKLDGRPAAVSELKELRETADKLSAIVTMFEKNR